MEENNNSVIFFGDGSAEVSGVVRGDAPRCDFADWLRDTEARIFKRLLSRYALGECDAGEAAAMLGRVRLNANAGR